MLPHNILFYYPYNKTMTGGPRVLLSLLELLDRDKYHPIVITQKQSPLVDELNRKNVEVVVLPLPPILDEQDGKVLKYGIAKMAKSIIQLLLYNLTVYRLLKDKKIKLIWARNIKAVLFVGFATLISNTILIWDIGLGDKFKGLVKILHFIGLNLTDLVVTEGKSQHEKMFGKTLTQLYTKKLIYVLPGIDQERVRFIESLSKDKNASPFNIISVATISPRKNQSMLILSLEQLVAANPQVRVSFVGTSPDEQYYQDLQGYIKTAGLEPYVSFLGWRNDIPELLQASNLLVLCSYNEGIPQAVVEAMHAGLPVVATRVGGVPDAVVDGETGFLVEVDDVEGMVQKIQYLMQHPDFTRRMGAKGKAFAQKNFTYQAYYQKYDAIFSRLITAN